MNLFKRKQSQEQTKCTFPNIECSNIATHKDTLMCELHNDEATNGWPRKELQNHLELVKLYKEEVWFFKSRNTDGGKQFEKEMLDLLARQEQEQLTVKKKYSISDKYYEKFKEKYQGKR